MRRLPGPRARRLRAAALGLVADAVVGEPPLSPHPLAVFGRSMQSLEARLYADDRAAGLVHLGAGLALGASAGMALPDSVATYLAVAGRGLGQAAAAVAGALDADDLQGARVLLPALVGRDPTGLDVKEVVRATVESVAENTVDAVVAPVLWAAAVGGAGALGYRAANTLDAMVGHHTARYERYGWASARLDDALNWVPARVTAVLVAAVRPAQAAAVWAVVRGQARRHPSPNAGVAEGAFAAALGLRLGGVNRYGARVELRPALGFGRAPEVGDIARAVRLSNHVGLALAALLGAGWRYRAGSGSRR